MKFAVAFLLLSLAAVALGAGKSCPKDNKSFEKEASVCLYPFVEFADKNPNELDIKRVCKVYNECKPCMKGLLGNCGGSPPFKNHPLYTNWQTVKQLDQIC